MIIFAIISTTFPTNKYKYDHKIVLFLMNSDKRSF